MTPLLLEHREAIAAICRRHGVRRLDVFGSALDAAAFDPSSSDIDVLVQFDGEIGSDIFLDLKEALEAVFSVRSIWSSEKRCRTAATRSGGGASSQTRCRSMPPDLSERDAALLLDMRNAVSDARSFISDLDRDAFLASRLHQSAVIRALEVLGEAANKITPATREALPDIPWREMIGMRHRLIHGYDDVRLDIVWTVVSVRLPFDGQS
jgi:uncharacterized protein with HEPN domain/predicted nucleotidyltransferase